MRIVFIGTGDIGIPVFKSLLESKDHHVLACVTQPDKPAGRRLELQGSPIKQVAFGHHVPIFQPERIRDETPIEQIRYHRPDVIVVMAYGQILPKEVLRIPTVACLNLHASLLPRHRGAAPIQAAIAAGDRESGITVMHMDEGLDTGDVLLTKSLRLQRRETAGTLHDRLAALAPSALENALALLKQGAAPRTPQDHSQATHAPKLRRGDGLISWTRTPEEIDRHIRAMNPWPGAFTWLSSPDGPRKLKVFTVIQHSKPIGDPATVVRADRHGVLVACRDGGVLLREVQLEGKKRMAARDFLMGTRVEPGGKLGETAAPAAG